MQNNKPSLAQVLFLLDLCFFSKLSSVGSQSTLMFLLVFHITTANGSRLGLKTSLIIRTRLRIKFHVHKLMIPTKEVNFYLRFCGTESYARKYCFNVRLFTVNKIVL